MPGRLRELVVLSTLLLTAATGIDGVELRSGALVLCGSSLRCTRPATIDFVKVRAATEEWKTISAEGIKRGSARYRLLLSSAVKRIKKACKALSREHGYDLVTCTGDIQNDGGLVVADLTKAVIEDLD